VIKESVVCGDGEEREGIDISSFSGVSSIQE